MPQRYVSQDLKARIPVLFYDQGYSAKEICGILGIKKSLVYQALAYFKAYGVAHNPLARKSGRRRLLSVADVNLVSALVNRRHTIYLDEIQDELYQERGVFVSIPTLCRTLRRLDFTRKIVSARALERNDLLRSAFMNKIADEVPDPNMMMFVDEAARNRRSSMRPRGWARMGMRCVQRRFFVRGDRYSILPILSLDGIITYDIIPGSVTSERFLHFLRELVVSDKPLILLSGLG